MEGEKGYNANLAQHQLKKLTLRLAILTFPGGVGVWIRWKYRLLNPVAVELEAGTFETNMNPKFKLFRVGGWLD